MPSSNANEPFRDEFRHDHEHWPAGHYRGRGNEQQDTGPSGRYVDYAAGPYLVPPRTREEMREAQAPRSGHAPRPGKRLKSYVRSDERIYEEVCDMLVGHSGIDVRDIEVTVDQGDVILRGTVPTRYARFYAEDLAAAVDGVNDVVNELRVAFTPDGRERGGPIS